jgi:hypothetical protein
MIVERPLCDISTEEVTYRCTKSNLDHVKGQAQACKRGAKYRAPIIFSHYIKRIRENVFPIKRSRLSNHPHIMNGSDTTTNLATGSDFVVTDAHDSSTKSALREETIALLHAHGIDNVDDYVAKTETKTSRSLAIWQSLFNHPERKVQVRVWKATDGSSAWILETVADMPFHLASSFAKGECS